MTEENGAEPEAEPETVAEPEPEPEAEPEAVSTTAADDDKPARKKKKKKAKAAPTAKPAPGAGTPEGETLARAVTAFEAGDYRAVRELTEKLVEVPDDEVARAARELRARTQIDPVQVGVVLACLALFAVIVYVYVVP